ncbi:MAG: reverse transcriptase-like protein [Candidatus Acidiferrales bacterium]
MTPPRKIPPPPSARLFSDSHATSAPPANVHIANIDGASRGNPGPASYAVVIRDAGGRTVLELSKHIGRETNNVAEYYALLAALDYAVAHGIAALRIRSDSELLVRQMQGRYKVKSADLRPLHERAAKLARQLSYFQIEHVRREMNRDADALANVALDRTGVPKFEHGKSDHRKSQAAVQAGESALLIPPSTSDGPAPSAPSPSMTRGHSRNHSRISAQFIGGVFVPRQEIDLPEGAEVTLEVNLPDKA